jgi:NTE family protein
MLKGKQNNTKLGLALSGGGFRSALFHIGVLARLAEQDLLRKIDVISSVSGGSIIAAYYYLKVKLLLEQHRAEDAAPPGREDFIRLVSEIEEDFLVGVQKNMFLRTFLDPVKNARMLAKEFSNTERLAELLTRHFYRPIFQKSDDLRKQDPILLKDISIRPLQENIASGTRIPFLIINATSLNTGHLWQFTSRSVGEQPTIHEPGDAEIDFFKKFYIADERLTMNQRKVLYNITLGQAVAASCCAPGILEPLEIRNLYRKGRLPITIRLVDGGLVDNQGLASLYSENCTHIICSDASDILQSENHPSSQFLNVAMRANDILMDRSRGKTLKELYKYGPGRFALVGMGDRETRNQIFPADSEKLVHLLTRIRTDLDSFTDIEAFCLMLYGYRLAWHILEEPGKLDLISDFPPATVDWQFVEIRKVFLENDAKRSELLHHLEVGARQMFKVFLLKKPLPYLMLLPLPLIMAFLALYLINRFSPMVFWGLLTGLVLVLIYTQNRRILKIMDHVKFLRRIKHRILRVMVSLRLPEPFSYIIAMASWIQLTLFDRLFLRYGRVRKKPVRLFNYRRNR